MARLPLMVQLAHMPQLAHTDQSPSSHSIQYIISDNFATVCGELYTVEVKTLKFKFSKYLSVGIM